MAEPQFTQHPDDDLPRTLRRERDARQRAQQSVGSSYAASPSSVNLDQPPGQGVTVTAFEVPFFRLMAFFMKAVLAAIPALILLGVILYAIGQAAQTLFPWLVKMRIVITFPG